MDYQQFYSVYGPESRIHDRMEGFGLPMPLLSRIRRIRVAGSFLHSSAPSCRTGWQAMYAPPAAARSSSGGSPRSARH